MNLSSPDLPTTILFFDHTAKMGGGEISLLNLVTHLDHRQFEPVVVLASDGPLHDKLREAGIETHILPLSENVTEVRKDALRAGTSKKQILEILLYAWRLRAFMRARGAQILHTNSLKADVIGAIAGKLAGRPVIWHVRDRIADDYLSPKATRAFRFLCRVLPDYVVVNSSATLESLELPAYWRARVIYNGVVHDGLPHVPYARPARRHSDDINSIGNNQNAQSGAIKANSPCIGIVGRISPWKGQDIFLRAAAIVLKKYPQARFQIIGAPLFGEEDYERELHDLSESLNLEQNVEWMGFRSDVPDLVSQLTIFVHASKTGEPFGQVVVEAMMAGRPVIATDGGGIPEIVLHEKTGLLVPMNNAEAMGEAILRLLEQPEFAKELSRAGHQRAIETFTIHHTVSKISHLYHYIIRVRQDQLRLRLTVLGAMGLGLLLAQRFRFERRDK